MLTYADRDCHETLLESALLLDGGRWRPLNICAGDGSVQIRDGSFAAQTLTYHYHSSTMTLGDLPSLEAPNDPAEQDIPWPEPPEDERDRAAGPPQPFAWPAPPDLSQGGT